MAIEINSVYSSYADSYTNTINKEKQKVENATTAQTTTISQTQLSSKAQALLEKLRKTYSNMDFMVADFDKGDDAKEILSRGTKEFSVLFSSEELEKMASDEKYLQEKLQGVEGAVRMSEQINEQFGFESAFGKTTNNSEITKIGISFNDDGTTTFFAELKKSSVKQRERIEKAREEKLADKKAEEKKAEREHQNNQWNSTDIKRTTVQADSMEELLNKVSAIDWSKVNENKKVAGYRFDFSI